MMTPLYKAILDYINKDMSRLHMPGHKGKNIYDINDLWKYDITEIEGLDNLLDSQGVIKQTEERFSKVYGSKKSAILTQGSTLGVQMMLTAAYIASKKKSNKIIIDRNAHVSAINTIALLDLDPVWIFQDKFNNKFMSGLISAENIEKKIKEAPEAKIVYVTSPNYFGQILDLKSIFKVCQKYDKFLLVDNAHGAHLKFISGCFHPIDQGCSACCDSLHKTLPVLTGGGLLHVLDERLAPCIKKAQGLFSSTSPSYLTMVSIDLLLSYINENLKREYEALIYKVKALNKMTKDKGFDIPEGNIDPVKFVIGPGGYDCGGREISELLRKFKIEPEYVSEYWVLLMMSPQNREIDFQRLKKAIEYMSDNFNKIKRERPEDNSWNSVNLNCMNLKRGLSVREAVLSQSEMIETKRSEGRVVASSVVTCPPCVPIITPGEIVSHETVEILLESGIKFLEVTC